MDAEIQIQFEDGPLTVPLGVHSPELDERLTAAGAKTAVFLPAYDPGAKPKVIKKALAKEKLIPAKLEARPTFPAEARPADHEPVPGWIVLSTSQLEARAACQEMGATVFTWCRIGSPMETHYTMSPEAEFFEGDDEVWTRVAKEGGRELWRALLLSLDGSKSWLSGIGLMIAAATVFALALDGVVGHVPFVGKWVVRSGLVPGVLLGLWLRTRKDVYLCSVERTQEEADEAWFGFTPEMIRLWIAAAALVMGLVAGRVFATGHLDTDNLEAFGGMLITAVWVLPAVGWSRNSEEATSAAMSAFFSSLMGVFGLKFLLGFAGMVNGWVWSGVRAYAFDVPLGVENFFRWVAALGSEAVFLALALGYSWTMAKRQFLAGTGPEPEDDDLNT